MPNIPLINISALWGALPQRRGVAQQIDAACRDTGFFCITGHGVIPEPIADVRADALAFFDRPLPDKLAIERQPPAYRGYIGLQTESLARSLGSHGANDFKEAFSMGPVDPPPVQNAAAQVHFAANRWPAEPSTFRPAFEAYYRRLAELAAHLLHGFALAALCGRPRELQALFPLTAGTPRLSEVSPVRSLLAG